MVPFRSYHSLFQPFPQAFKMDVLATANASTWGQQTVTSASLFLREADSARALDHFPLLEDSSVPDLSHRSLSFEAYIEQLPPDFDGIALLQAHRGDIVLPISEEDVLLA